MESNGRPSAVHASADCWAELLRTGYVATGAEEHRSLEIKGKGLMETVMLPC